jgi:hypothetical protein
MVYTYYGCLEASYLEEGEVDQLRNGILEYAYYATSRVVPGGGRGDELRNGILEYAYYATSRVRGLCLEEGEVDQLEQDRLLLGRVRSPHGEET